MIRFPRSESISFVLLLMCLLLIKWLCACIWRPDEAFLHRLEDFRVEQLRQDSIKEVRYLAYRQRDSLRAARSLAASKKRSLAESKNHRDAVANDRRDAASNARSTKETSFSAAQRESIDPRESITPREPIDQHEPITPMVQVAAQSLNINTADSAALVAVDGIGAYSAQRILAYRQALGGFVSLKQLSEIKGLRAENLEELMQVALIDSAKVRKIAINRASLKTMVAHPYIVYSQAVAIDDWRRERGRIDSLANLSFLEEFTPSDIERLQPYLSFE